MQTRLKTGDKWETSLKKDNKELNLKPYGTLTQCICFLYQHFFDAKARQN